MNNRNEKLVLSVMKKGLLDDLGESTDTETEVVALTRRLVEEAERHSNVQQDTGPGTNMVNAVVTTGISSWIFYWLLLTFS